MLDDKNKILPITQPFTGCIESQLYSFYRRFRQYGCTYMYYTVNDLHDGRLRFTTNEDWIKLYLEEGLVTNDPVKQVCEQNLCRIVAWENIPILGKKQKKVMEARVEYGLINGINFIYHDKNTGLQKILALCTDCNSHDFVRDIFAEELRLKAIVSELFSIV